MAEAWIEERFAKRSEMEKNRLEAFSDGVLAIVITIMVLELKVPHGASIDALEPLLPVFLSYVLSFLYVGIYWNNHHHMFQTTKHVSGGILWANLHLLFWLSLFPFSTAWIGENHLASMPTAAYGFVLLMAGVNTDSYNLQNPVGTNLAYYMPDAAPWLRTVLSFFDVIGLWVLVLLVIGTAIVAKVQRGKAAIVVIGWWLFGLIVMTGIAVASS